MFTKAKNSKSLVVVVLISFLVAQEQIQQAQAQLFLSTSQQVLDFYNQDCMAIRNTYSALGGFYSFTGYDCCNWNFVTCGGSDPGATFRTPAKNTWIGFSQAMTPNIPNLSATPKPGIMGIGFQNAGSATLADSSFVYSCSSGFCNMTTVGKPQVTSIFWRQQGFAGLLAPSLAQLTTAPLLNGALSQLQILSLSGNEIRGPIPAEIGQFRNLQGLELDGNAFTGSIPSSFGSLQSLTRLTLSNNQLSGTIPSTLATIPTLRSIELKNNFLTGTIPSQIYSISTLTGLILDNNRLTGTILPPTFNLPALTQLRLSNNAFSGSIPTQISQLSSLLILSLNGNMLSGTIPSHIGILTQLQYLALNENQFTGTVPTEIGNLKSAISLFLNKNSLSGPLTSTIGSMTSLQFLRVENNQFSNIPTTLSSLNTIATVVLPNDNGTSIPYDLRAQNPLFTLSPDNWAVLMNQTLISKRQQLSTVAGYTAQKLYEMCPLNNVTNPNVPAGCIAGIYQKFCYNLLPTDATGYANCRNAYDTVFAQSIFAPIGAVCPAWRNGPKSMACAQAIAAFKVDLGYIVVTPAIAQNLVVNIIGNPIYAPCVTIPGSVTCNWNS